MEQLSIIRQFLRSKGHGTAENSPHLHSYEDVMMRDEMAVRGVSTVVPDPEDVENFVQQFEQSRKDMAEFAAVALASPTTKAKKK